MKAIVARPTLWAHQAAALTFLASRYQDGHRAAALHIDMGGGKTRIVVEHVAQWGYRRVLVVCPKSVAPVWRTEVAKWWPRSATPIVLDLSQGAISRRAQELGLYAGRPNMPVLIAISNYDAYWREPLRSAILRARFDCVVYDESHRLKAPGGKASLFAAYLRDRIPHRLALTGTPMPHSPLDIYAQYRALDVGIFGRSFAAFKARYAIMGGFEGRQVVGFRNLNDLAQKVALLAYRVEPERLDKPPATDTSRYCYLEPQAARVYHALEEELVAEVEAGTVTAANVLVKLLRLQQITSGIVRTEDGQEAQVSTAKREALAEVLDDLSPTEAVVVFCRFRSDLDTVHSVARALGRGSLEMSGRRNELREWQEGKAPILAAQMQAGALGVSMVRARYAIFYSLGYSLGDYQQARARLVRPGQQRPVTFVHLLARGTVDEQVMQAIEAKADVVEYVLGLLKQRGDSRRDSHELRATSGHRYTDP